MILESDCLTVINAVRSKEEGGSLFHLVLDDIYQILDSFESVSWAFVRRNCNRVAHVLAHCLPWSVGRRIWLSSFPDDIAVCLAQDFSSNEN